jgi:hypothetical protein
VTPGEEACFIALWPQALTIAVAADRPPSLKD